jgi:hypothetical protein
MPIYFAYAASVVEDGDLNALNNVDCDYNGISQQKPAVVFDTFNLPSYHSHGGVVLWAPLYLFGKGLEHLYYPHPVIPFTKCILSFGTTAFSFLTLYFSYLLTASFYSRKLALYSTLGIFFGTPLFYYTLFETANADIPISLISVLHLWIGLRAIHARDAHTWLAYGLLTGIGVTIKPTFWPHAFIPFLLLTVYAPFSHKRWREGSVFIVGFLFPLFLQGVNDHLKYGTLQPVAAGALNLSQPIILEQLFSLYRGYLYTSPILAFCMMSMLTVLMRYVRRQPDAAHPRDLFLGILSSLLLFQIIVFGLRYHWAGGTLGGRVLLCELPSMVWLHAHLMDILQKKKLFRVAQIVVFFCILWNFLIATEHIFIKEWFYFSSGFPPLWQRFWEVRYLLFHLLVPVELKLKLKADLPLLFLIGLLIRRFPVPRFEAPIPLAMEEGRKTWLLMRGFICYLAIAYGTVTLLNVHYNPQNARHLRGSDKFKNAVAISPHHIQNAENLESMSGLIDYFLIQGEPGKAKKIREVYNRTTSSGGAFFTDFQRVDP